MRLRLGSFVAVVAALLPMAAAGPAAASPGGASSPAGAATPSARYYNGTPSVGVLFRSAQATSHSCTASVVDSPGGDLLLTAAHCLQGRSEGYMFVPEYHDGKEPFGAWTVTAAFAPSGWMTGQSPQDDVAFLVVAPQTRGGHRAEIQAVTGGHAIGSAPASGRRVWVPAYAAGENDRPFTCNAAVYYRNGYPAFDCEAYPNGTSGSAWLLDTPAGRIVVGVIGGWHQGGCTVETSFTAAFGQQVRTTYQRAVRDQDPDTLPSPGGSGC